MVAEADYQTAQEIRKLAHEWLDAVRRRDRDSLERILADDFLIAGWQLDGRLADKQFYIEDCLKPVDVRQGSYKFDQWRIRVYRDMAVVNCVLDIRALVDGHDWGGEFLFTDVWLRERGSWRVVTRHTSPLVRQKKGQY